MILRYKQIAESWPEDQNLYVLKKKKENLLSSGFYHSGGPQSKNKKKTRQIFGLCQRTKKKKNFFKLWEHEAEGRCYTWNGP